MALTEPSPACDAPCALERVAVAVDRDGPVVVVAARVRGRPVGFILTLPEHEAQVLAANIWAATGRRVEYSRTVDLDGALDVT